MLRNRPPAARGPGHTLTVSLENLPHCNNGGASAQLSSGLYSFHPGICQQNGYGLFSAQHQEALLDTTFLHDAFISDIRRKIRGLIFGHIKRRFAFSLLKDADLAQIAWTLEVKLHEEATSLEKYMDFNTLFSRVDNLVSWYGNGISSLPRPFFSNGSMGLAATEALPAECNAQVTSNAGIYPGLYGANNMSNFDGSYLQDANGGLPDEGSHSFIVGSHDRQYNTMPYVNTTVCSTQPLMQMFSTEATFSDRKTPISNASQTVLYSNDLTEGSLEQNFSSSLMSLAGSDKRLDDLDTLFAPLSGDLNSNGKPNTSALKDCSSTVFPDSVEIYGNPNSNSTSTLNSNDPGDFLQHYSTAFQHFCQTGPHFRQTSSVEKPFSGSNLNSVSKLQMVDQLTQNEKTNATLDTSVDELQFLYGTKRSRTLSLPCTQLESSGNQLPKNFEGSIVGDVSSHTANRFASLDKSLECHVDRTSSFVSGSATANSTLDYQELPPKRLKLDPPWSSNLDLCANRVAHCGINDSSRIPSSQEIVGDGNFIGPTMIPELEAKHCSTSSQGSSGTFSEDKYELSGSLEKVCSDGLCAISEENSDHMRGEDGKIQLKVSEDKPDLRVSVETELRKMKLKGVSLIEWFTAEQVRQHLKSFKHSQDEGMMNSEKHQDLQYPRDENICQICGLSSLSFDPPTIYCSACLNRIGRSRAYYIVGGSEALASSGQNYFCNTCYKGSHGGSIQYGKFSISKAMLEKKKNDDRDPEPWVQCDKCSAWQHQICTLFNYKKNEGERAEYICPTCYLEDMESGERQPLSPHTRIGAKDLPKSRLSEHIENRLLMRLKKEREERAKVLGKHVNEVPEAKDLVVRVVSSVDRNLEVHKSFSEIFEEDNYPKEFPYKSKAILLFQNIEGADVCLFGMYAQEYGSGCAYPNQRHIYLSYIDSVKYFQPDIKAVYGEALRTLVYHEILIGYLDYSKKRGFASCYIWVCPATKREDFIFNCHPEKQKMPKKDKLRDWYFMMLEKASKEDIVVYKTNLYDQFFVSSPECKASITTARLPYFDGDYWPGIAEKVLDNLREQEEGKEPQKKGKIGISRRALKAVRHGTSGQKSKDILLMNKLEELILPKKEDFIMLQLHHACDRCCKLIMSGKRWVCNLCRKFQLCEKCHDVEQELDEKDRHPVSSAEKHSFEPVDVLDIPEDTTDEDDDMESEYFDSRMAFLGLCQGEHYQYDSLRHAKYSTMMILYHIHNASRSTSIVSCAVCHSDIKSGQGWHCEECPDFVLCNSCKEREGRHHMHQLVSHASADCVDEQNGISQDRPDSLDKSLLEILDHASVCSLSSCSYQFCRRIKIFFHHTVKCRTHAKGGCDHCKKIWRILKLHASTCNKEICPTPRCMDIRKYNRKLKELELLSNSRRRAGTLQSCRGEGDLVSENSR